MTVLLKLALLFLTLSLLAVGGANGVVPAMQHAVVDTYGWASEREFLDLFALSRVAPGPGSLIVTLVGQKAAGLSGALVATVAMFGPPCLMVHLAAGVWRRTSTASWRVWVERGLAPVAVGLVFASGFALIRGTEHAWAAYGLTAAATLLLATTELHPLLVLGMGACAGWLLGL